tara:strand:+ start:353 stop:706 length:354 start_codon:yes stop_codon:yes gene_type:complete
MLQAKGYQATLEIIVQSANKSEYVDGAVTLAVVEPYSIGGEINLADGEVCIPNRLVGDFVKRHENIYFRPSAHLHPKNALEELECSKGNGAVLIKLIPNIEDINPFNFSCRVFTRGW